MHCGSRILLRKTGDQLISALVDTEDVIWANQNVYVVKAKSEVNICFIQGLIASRLCSFLYRASPLGQMNRPMAQLRIIGIKSIPFPNLKSNALAQSYNKPTMEHTNTKL